MYEKNIELDEKEISIPQNKNWADKLDFFDRILGGIALMSQRNYHGFFIIVFFILISFNILKHFKYIIFSSVYYSQCHNRLFYITLAINYLNRLIVTSYLNL